MEETEHVTLTIEAVKDAMGDEAFEFIEAMEIVDAIIHDPRDFHGNRALDEAARLAALRTRISVKAQFYKTTEKSLKNTKRKNVLLAMYHALEENINTLKLLGRAEARL